MVTAVTAGHPGWRTGGGAPRFVSGRSRVPKPGEARTTRWMGQRRRLSSMPTDILTTAQAARLLGISVRTAQLLIEGGSLTSWKTPGGHRRVYRADVEALVAGPDPSPAASSALVIVVASPDRLARYEEALRGVGECLTDGHDDVHAAAVAIGARLPAAVVVDLEDGDPERTAL